MEGLLLVEYDARAPGARQALLGRVEALVLACKGQLRFVATERRGEEAAREIMVVDLARAADAAAIIADWRADAAFPNGVEARVLMREPVRAAGPVEALFP
jgi:hypothetical protein